MGKFQQSLWYAESGGKWDCACTMCCVYTINTLVIQPFSYQKLFHLSAPPDSLCTCWISDSLLYMAYNSRTYTYSLFFAKDVVWCWWCILCTYSDAPCNTFCTHTILYPCCFSLCVICRPAESLLCRAAIKAGRTEGREKVSASSLSGFHLKLRLRTRVSWCTI